MSRAQSDISEIEVLETSPQPSHSQWWRISPLSMNSDAIGATISSSQWGQRTGVAKARMEESFVQYS